MNIRPMTFDDIDFALRLTSCEGWSDIRSDFQSLITHEPTGAFVAEQNKVRIGMVSAVSYGFFGFIGSLIVLPEYRHTGIGSKLMHYAISYLQKMKVTAIMLDSVVEAIPFYQSLGFSIVCESLRMKGIVDGRFSSGIHRMTYDILPTIYDLDQKHFGADRSHFIFSRFNEFPTLCKVLIVENQISGYIMGSRRQGQIRVAPWIMENPSVNILNMIQSIAMESDGLPLSLGTLECNDSTVSILRQLNLIESTPSTRMVLGNAGGYTLSDGILAIGSPAKG